MSVQRIRPHAKRPLRLWNLNYQHSPGREDKPWGENLKEIRRQKNLYQPDRNAQKPYSSLNNLKLFKISTNSKLFSKGLIYLRAQKYCNLYIFSKVGEVSLSCEVFLHSIMKSQRRLQCFGSSQPGYHSTGLRKKTLQVLYRKSLKNLTLKC